jgi:hypothetical protein
MKKNFLTRVQWRMILPLLGGATYLILECKIRIFKDVVHEDGEFAHDGSEGDFGRFACGAEPLVKLFSRWRKNFFDLGN